MKVLWVAMWRPSFSRFPFFIMFVRMAIGWTGNAVSEIWSNFQVLWENRTCVAEVNCLGQSRFLIFLALKAGSPSKLGPVNQPVLGRLLFKTLSSTQGHIQLRLSVLQSFSEAGREGHHGSVLLAFCLCVNDILPRHHLFPVNVLYLMQSHN